MGTQKALLIPVLEVGISDEEGSHPQVAEKIKATEVQNKMGVVLQNSSVAPGLRKQNSHAQKLGMENVPFTNSQLRKLCK